MRANQEHGTIRSLESHVAASGLLGKSCVAGLYVSAGRDLRPLTHLHPDHLDRMGATGIAPPNFWVYVDREEPAMHGDTTLNFADERTTISTARHEPVRVAGLDANVLELVLRSDRLRPRRNVIVRINATNETIVGAALSEAWRPTWVVSVCDGCAMWGKNALCESDLGNPLSAIRSGLGPTFWVSDHFPGCDARSKQGQELVDGEFVDALDACVDTRLEQICKVGESWRSSNVTEDLAGQVDYIGIGARVLHVQSRLDVSRALPQRQVPKTTRSA